MISNTDTGEGFGRRTVAGMVNVQVTNASLGQTLLQMDSIMLVVLLKITFSLTFILIIMEGSRRSGTKVSSIAL